MLKQLSALILFSALSFPQNGDTLKIKSNQTKLDTIITSISDTASVVDTSKIIEAAQKDTLVPIQGMPLTDVSTIIGKSTFLFDNYRYTGDLLRSFSLNFTKDLGFVGYPHETFIYGVGNNAISYLQDGVLINNRYTNSLDLNFVQSEDIDSIEIVPSPRGFLYGPYNNPVTVNFITRDFISGKPYSRIKYYEGPDGEGMIDGKFSTKIANRWNLSFQLTNRSKDDTYVNTDLSLWQANAKLKYFLSNSINITGSYYFVDYKQGLNGGVDYDSLSKISDSPSSDLYQPFVAPVLYPNQKLDVTQHNFGLRTLAKTSDNSKLDLSFYYRYGMDKLNDNTDTSVYKQEWENKTLGGTLGYFQKSEFLNLDLFAVYEDNNWSQYTESYFFSTTDEMKDINYSVGGVLSGNILNNVIVPSIFYKYDYKDFGGEKTLGSSGYGFDLKISVHQILDFYTGYSTYNQIFDNAANLFEMGVAFQKDNLRIGIKYFNADNLILYLPNLWSLLLSGAEIGYSSRSAKGIGLNLNYKFYVILFESNFSYYDLNTSRNRDLPEYQFIGGLFVNDLFFDNNLDLKAGFKFYYTGKINSYWQVGADVDPTNKLDFTLAGEIKKVAVFYFIWENLFGNQYYITPYYPMPERNIRFGLAWELFN